MGLGAGQRYQTHLAPQVGGVVGCALFGGVIVCSVCSPKEIDDEEYNSFYAMFSRDSKDPLAKTHFTAEGEVTFRSILFVPGVSDHMTSHGCISHKLCE